MLTKSILSFGILAALAALPVSAAHAQSINPILQYTFNDAGTTTGSTGTDTSASTTLTFITKTTDTTAPNLHGAAGSGVSGQTGDIAFNNTAASAMGRATTTGGGQARNGAAGAAPTGGPASANGLASFTVQGWFKTDGAEVIGGDARLFSDANMANAGIYVSGPGNNTGSIRLGLNGQIADATTNSFSADTGTWTFYAATYNTATNTASFYRGTTTTGVTLLNTATLSVGGAVSGTNTSFFDLGNFGDTANTSGALNNRPFDGFLDDTRLYGSTTDSSGALLLRDLETIRVADINNTAPVIAPEPSETAVLGLGMLGLAGLALLARRRQGASSAALS